MYYYAVWMVLFGDLLLANLFGYYLFGRGGAKNIQMVSNLPNNSRLWRRSFIYSFSCDCRIIHGFYSANMYLLSACVRKMNSLVTVWLKVPKCDYAGPKIHNPMRCSRFWSSLSYDVCAGFIGGPCNSSWYFDGGDMVELKGAPLDRY